MKSLKGLSDNELVRQLRNLVKKEHQITINILTHLAEVRRRELYLARAYNSLFEYCRGELGYTDASAWRRANAAESIAKCPDALELLKTNRVNLSTLAAVSRVITPRILREICGKSKTEVELLVAAWDPKRAVPDRTRPVMVPRLVESGIEAAPSGDRRLLTSADARQAPAGNETSTPDQTDRPFVPPENPLRCEAEHQNHIVSEVPRSGIFSRERLEFEQKWRVEGVVSKAVKEKLDRCKALLSSKYPRGVDYDTLLDELTERFLDREDPDRRAERRERREKKKRQQPVETRSPKVANNPNGTKTSNNARTRYIPARVKEKVWAKDKGRCAFQGTDGRRCNSTYHLQYDHYPVPYARGGPSTADNLRLLCARHNRYSAEQVYGKKYTERHDRNRLAVPSGPYLETG